MHELQQDVAETIIVARANVLEGATVQSMRLVDAPPGAKVRLDNGRMVVPTGIVIQGACFVRPVVENADECCSCDELRLGSMEVLHGGKLVTRA